MHSRHVARTFPILLTTCLMLFVTARCRAQGLPPCPGVGRSGELYLIFVDPLDWTGLPAPVNTAIQKSMQFAVKTKIEALNTEIAGIQFVNGQQVPPLEPVLCSGRIPQGTVSFDDNEFQMLSQNQVLLEIWGSILDSDTGQGSLSFVLVPVRQFTKPAIYDVALNLGPAAQAKKSMREFLSKTKRLTAYVEMVLGVRLFQNGNFPQSITYVCRGISDLQSLQKDRTAPTPARDQKLITDLKKVVAQAIQQQKVNNEVAAALGADSPEDCPAGAK